MTDRTQHALDAIDHALDDWTVSEDAMRWKPESPPPTMRIPPIRAVFDGGDSFVLQPYLTEQGYLVETLGVGHVTVSRNPTPEQQLAAYLGVSVERVGLWLQAFARAVEGIAEAIANLPSAHWGAPEAADVRRARALRLRRERNTGPSRDLTRRRRSRRLP